MNNDHNLRECRKERAEMEEVIFLADQGRRGEFNKKQEEIYQSLMLTNYILKTINPNKKWYGKVYGGAR